MDEALPTLFQKVLRDGGYSVTTARKLVFELLQDHEPQSMHELTLRVHGRIDRASLYRTIGLFERLGIAQRVYVGWKYKLELTDVFSHHHHHISCLGCGKVMAIKEDDEIERFIHTVAAKHHLVATTHQLEIQGYCKLCQNGIKIDQ